MPLGPLRTTSVADEAPSGSSTSAKRVSDRLAGECRLDPVQEGVHLFDVPDNLHKSRVLVDEDMVRDKLQAIAKNRDLSQYIL